MPIHRFSVPILAPFTVTMSLQISSEMEPLREDRITALGTFHILVNQRNRQHQAEIVGQQHTRQKHQKAAKGGVLEVSQLHFHWTEFNTPSEAVGQLGGGRRLEAQRRPNWGLDAVEMLQAILTIAVFLAIAILFAILLLQLLQTLREHQQWIPIENVRNVACQCWVNAGCQQLLHCFLVATDGDVVEWFGWGVQEAVDGAKASFAALLAFLRCTVIGKLWTM